MGVGMRAFVRSCVRVRVSVGVLECGKVEGACGCWVCANVQEVEEACSRVRARACVRVRVSTPLGGCDVRGGI